MYVNPPLDSLTNTRNENYNAKPNSVVAKISSNYVTVISKNLIQN